MCEGSIIVSQTWNMKIVMELWNDNCHAIDKEENLTGTKTKVIVAPGPGMI